MTSDEPASSWAVFARNLGDNLGRLREERGLSQEQMIARAGISRQTYQRVERGALPVDKVANPTLATLLAICSALDVDLGEVVPPYDKAMVLDHAATAGKNHRGRVSGSLPPQPASAAKRGSDANGARGTDPGLPSRPLPRSHTDAPRHTQGYNGARSQESRNQESGPWHERYGVRFQR